MKAFSQLGVVVCARVPRRPSTGEPHKFAFISYLVREDAQRVARRASIDVQITPTWTLSLKPRLAKYGQSTDKRVAVQTEDDSGWAFDWVHVCRR